MFRKLVSNLPFSPALVGQLGFYARRLKKEEATRRLGLVFTALALVIQSFAVFSPPEAANAANPSDFIHGGIKNKSQLLAAYDASARGNGDIKKFFDYAGISRAEVAAMKDGSINSRSNGTGKDAWVSWGRVSRFSAADGEVKHDAGGTTVYSRPLWRLDSKPYTIKNGSTYPALVGESQKLGKFYVMLDCANLVTSKLPIPPPPPPPPAPKPESRCAGLQLKRIDRTNYTLTGSASVVNGAKISAYNFTVKNASGANVASQRVASTTTTATSQVFELPAGAYTGSLSVTTTEGERSGTQCTVAIKVAPPDRCVYNPDITAEDQECQPCPENPNLWYKDADCAPKVASDKEAVNLTQGRMQADTITANASDRIEYKVSLYNVGKVPATVEFNEQLSDVLEYSTLQDNGGGQFNTEENVLSWGNITLQPDQQVTRTFVVAVLDKIPSTPQGTSDPTSYDCIMTNAFGNTVNIDVNCEAPKLVEEIVQELPKTGAGENILFAGVLGSVVTFFYARSRQMSKEVRLIRKEFNMGTL